MERSQPAPEQTTPPDLSGLRELFSEGLSVAQIRELGGAEKLARRQVTKYINTVVNNPDSPEYLTDSAKGLEFLAAQRRRTIPNRLSPELEAEILKVSILNQLRETLEGRGVHGLKLRTAMQEHIAQLLMWVPEPSNT